MISDARYRNGYINLAGKVVIEPQFEDADEFYEGRARVKVDGKWGYIDPTGRLVVPTTYDCAENFSEGRARVTRGDRYGYVDTRGRVSVPMTFDATRAWSSFIFSSGLAPAPGPDGTLYGYIDRRGRMVIAPRFKHASAFAEGLAEVVVDTDLGPRTGYIDLKGRMVVAAQYDSGEPFSGGLALVRTGREPRTWLSRFVDRTGRVVLEPDSRNVESFGEGLAPIGVGAFTSTSRHTIKIQNGCGGGYPGGVPGAYVEFGKIGYIDVTGRFVIAPAYVHAGVFSEGLAPVRVDESWGYIDKAGRIVISPQFEYAESFFRGLARVLLTNSRTGMIDRTGRIVWSTPE